MCRSRRAVLVSLTVFAFVLGAWWAPAILAGAGPAATEAPALPPADDPPGDPEEPALDPGLGLMPEPEAACYTGWCSNDQQCIEWLNNPDARCYKQPGATCGRCLDP